MIGSLSPPPSHNRKSSVKIKENTLYCFDYDIPNLEGLKIRVIGSKDMVILSGGTQLGVFCLLGVEFHRGGSASNGATRFSFFVVAGIDLSGIYLW